MSRWLKIIPFMLFVSQAFSVEDVRIVGRIEVPLAIDQALNKGPSTSDYKIISLIEFEIPTQTQQSISSLAHKVLQNSPYHEEILSSTQSIEHKQLGMNKVPVLDQGQHGSCVIFAVTGAIDAELKKGDYVSQLCLLQLGQYLEHKNQGVSGWNGANAELIFNRIYRYGVINKKNQQLHACGGVKEYPLRSMPSTEMTDEEYAQYSELISNNKVRYKRITRSPKDNQFINTVKLSLKSGHRLLLSVLFPVDDSGSVGANAWHHYFSDTWVLTPEVVERIDAHKKMPGHLMIITGFDDDAVAMDSSGHRHHGLLTLRNSWGSDVGDWGDFYMSYDYFKTLAVNVYQIDAT